MGEGVVTACVLGATVSLGAVVALASVVGGIVVETTWVGTDSDNVDGRVSVTGDSFTSGVVSTVVGTEMDSGGIITA